MSGDPSSRLCVGLVEAQSPALTKDGVFIAIFTKDSVLRFYGNVAVRVIGGVVKLESYAMMSSADYLPLNIPFHANSMAMSMEAVDPGTHDADFEEALQPFRTSSALHFHYKSNPHTVCATRSGCERGCVTLDIGEEDVNNLNILVQSSIWKNSMWAIALLKPVDSGLTDMLAHYGQGVSGSQQLRGFSVASSHQTMQVPDCYLDLAWYLMTQPAASILICGESGTGKSTLGRFLINYLMNRYAAVGYLECDPGQCEFTCPEVLSLHVLRAPVFGPPYAHQRSPIKAYYFGDKTPKTDPGYYIRLLQSLNSYFSETVRGSFPQIPLIINTCGWLNDMGVPLFLDIVRLLKPTHIIRLLSKESDVMDSIRHLPPLTEELFTSTPGLFTPTDRASDLDDQSAVPLQQLNLETLCASAPSRPATSKGVDVALVIDEDLDDRVDRTVSNDIEMYGSSEDGFFISDASDGAEDNSSPISDKEIRARKKRSLKRRRLYVANAKHNLEKRQALVKKRSVVLHATCQWEEVFSYKIQQIVAQNAAAKSSAQIRKLGLLAYFSPLLSEAQHLSKERGLPEHHQNLLLYAPPMAVPWRDVALHVLHKPVPPGQMLYAFNGKLVCLGHVDPEQIVKSTPCSSEMFSQLKSSTPFIDFIGLGLLRGIDAVKKLLYVTTPLSPREVSVKKVNVFLLGNPDCLRGIFKECLLEDGIQPYLTKTFTPVELGRYVWNSSKSRR